MFEEIAKKNLKFQRELVEAYDNSIDLNLSPDPPIYRELAKSDLDKILSVVDQAQASINYDHVQGACLFAHHTLKRALQKHGYNSEIIVGDVLIDDKPYMSCKLEDLQEQLVVGKVGGYQKVHCWLLLENYFCFDVSLCRDFTNGVYAAEIWGVGTAGLIGGHNVCYKPILMGETFIERTNQISH
ncbi:hypothetical protein ACE34P_003247 [Vibrio fluvialis]